MATDNYPTKTLAERIKAASDVSQAQTDDIASYMTGAQRDRIERALVDYTPAEWIGIAYCADADALEECAKLAGVCLDDPAGQEVAQ